MTPESHRVLAQSPELDGGQRGMPQREQRSVGLESRQNLDGRGTKHQMSAVVRCENPNTTTAFLFQKIIMPDLREGNARVHRCAQDDRNIEGDFRGREEGRSRWRGSCWSAPAGHKPKVTPPARHDCPHSGAPGKSGGRRSVLNDCASNKRSDPSRGEGSP